MVGYVRRLGDSIDLDRLVVPVKNRAGDVTAWCIAMPFLRPSDVPRVEGSADPYMSGIDLLYRQAFELAASKRSAGQAILAMGHCHMTGGQVSEESERRIVIGGVEALSASVFDPQIAYVALGHLHLAQKIGGDPTRRYCGSPLPMSFSEMDPVFLLMNLTNWHPVTTLSAYISTAITSLPPPTSWLPSLNWSMPQRK